MRLKCLESFRGPAAGPPPRPSRVIGTYFTEAGRRTHATQAPTPLSPESTMPRQPLLRRTVSALAVAAALLLPTLAAAPAHAESGAHRNPPAPPVHTPVVVAERD